jgi:uncharacterized protein (DUF1919 family)
VFKQKISISINSTFDKDKLYDEFETVMSNFCKTGQVLSDYETPFVTANELIALNSSIAAKR